MNYIDYLIKGFQDCEKCDEQIYDESIAHKQFTPARNWIIHYLLKVNEIERAIAFLKEGYCVDDWEKDTYAKWHIGVYKQYGYEKDYEIEVKVYITSGAEDAFNYYKKYRDEVGETQWVYKRNEILHLIKDKALQANCYNEERMPKQLVNMLEAKEIGFMYLQQFEKLLLEYNKARIFSVYSKECNIFNQNYKLIASLLLHLKKLLNEEQHAYKKRDELLETFRRWHNLVDLLKKV